jgi:hypothetical protein
MNLNYFTNTVTVDSKWAEIRQLRDDLLKQTDWTQLPDVQLDDATKAAYTAYRQALRELPQNNTDPFNIVLPSKP